MLEGIIRLRYKMIYHIHINPLFQIVENFNSGEILCIHLNKRFGDHKSLIHAFDLKYHLLK